MKLRIILLVLALLPAAHSATLLRIACGSSTGGMDAQGHAWQADAFYAGGTAYTTTALAALDLPYRTLRYGASAFTYAIPAANGDYILKLSFIENRTASSSPPVKVGQRKFSVSVAGSPVVQVVASNLDLYATVGSMAPYVISVPVSVFGGKVFITVAPDVGNALISGIQLDSVDAPPPPPSVPFLTGLESAPPVCPASGLTLFLATDSNHLFWCFAGSSWHVIGDVRNAPPELVKLEECNGSGAAWNCAGLYRATIKRTDGSVVPLVGSIFDPPITLPAVWVAAK